MSHPLNMHLYTCEGCFTTFGVEDHEEQDQSQLVCPNCQTDDFLEDAGYGFFTMTQPPEAQDERDC